MQMPMLTFIEKKVLLPHAASLAIQRKKSINYSCAYLKMPFFHEQQKKFAAGEKTAFQIALSSALLHTSMWEIINNNNKECNAHYINWVKLCIKSFFLFGFNIFTWGNKYDR